MLHNAPNCRICDAGDCELCLNDLAIRHQATLNSIQLQDSSNHLQPHAVPSDFRHIRIGFVDRDHFLQLNRELSVAGVVPDTEYCRGRARHRHSRLW